MKEEKIAFNMQNISIDQFAIMSNTLPKEGKVGTEIQIGIDKKNKGVAIRIRVSYVDESETVVLLIQVTCMFAVMEEHWQQYVGDDGRVSLPHGFLAHLAMHAFGTMRGILYCKTVDTALGAVILPPTNVDSLIPETFVM